MAKRRKDLPAKEKRESAKPRHLVDIESVTRALLTRILGLSVRTLDRLEAEGVVVPAVRGKGGRPSLYSLEKSVRAYLQHVVKNPTPSSTGNARARRDESQAQLNELRLSRERKELVPLEEVVQKGQHYTKGWAQKVRSLPRRFVQEGIIARDQEPRAAALCQEVLIEISSWKDVDDIKRDTASSAA